MSPKIRALAELSRVSNLPTVWTNCIAGWVLGGGMFEIGLLPLLLGASLLYSAGMVLNDVFDFEWDRHHRTERPIPRGAIGLRPAMGAAIGAVVVAVVLLVVAGVDLIWALALLAAILVYNKTHKRWLGAVYVMGACRLLLYLCAASAGGDASKILVLVSGLAVGVYTVGITVVARGEARDGAVDKFGLALLAAPLMAAAFTQAKRLETGSLFGVCFLIWIGWTLWALNGLRRGTKEATMAGVGHLLAGFVLIDAMVVAAAYPWLGVTIVLLFPLVLLWQKRVAAT